ncbi:hypothetical protein BDV19DRAFT_388495 [Aspergillus venezuelensis]
MADKPVPEALLAAEIAKLLDELKIPNILWGWLGLAFAGSTYGFQEIDFVIPDHYIPKAVVEVGSRYPVCNDASCLEWEGDRTNVPDFGLGLARCTAKNAWHAPAVAHFHIGQVGDGEGEGEDGALLSLHKKSQLLPWLPDYTHGPPPQDDPHLTVSSDPRLPPCFPTGVPDTFDSGPTGPWTGLYSIQIMNPDSFTESVLYLLMLHEPSHLPSEDDSHWSNVFERMEYALLEGHRGYLPQYRRNLQPQYRLAWKFFNGGHAPGVNRRVPLLRLRNHMIKTGELPRDLPLYDFSDFLGYDKVRSHMEEDLDVNSKRHCKSGQASALPGSYPSD